MTQVDLVLTAEAARLLGLSSEGVRYLARIGRLQTLRTSGGIRLFSRTEVEQLAAERLAARAGTPSTVQESARG